MSKKYCFVGLDCGRYHHTAVLLNNQNNKKLDTIKFKNNNYECKMFAKKISKMENVLSKKAIIGFEGSNGNLNLLTNYLNHGRFTLKGIPPIRIKRHKDYFTQPIHNDTYDAYVIADYLRNQHNRVLSLRSNIDPNIKALKELSKLYKNYAKQHTQYSNRLQQTLIKYFPEYINEEFFSKITCKTSLVLLHKYPTPGSMRELSIEKLTKILNVNSRGHLGQQLAKKILNIVQQMPFLDSEEILGFKVSSLARTLLFTREQLHKLKRKMKVYLTQVNAASIINSLPGTNDILTARFLGAIESIDKFHSSDALALYSGIACIDDRSGKRKKAKKAFRVNKMAKDALMQIAHCSINVNPDSQAFYKRKRKEGKTHWQAIKSLARNIVRVLYSMLKNKTKYQRAYA